MDQVQPHYLSTRENWQQEATPAGASLRDAVATTLRSYLDRTAPGEFEVTIEPKDLAQIYYEYDWTTSPEKYRKPAIPGSDTVWYDAEKGVFLTLRSGKIVAATGGGCIPDVKLKNLKTGRAYLIECKQQNDAGNAHERCAKYATPSIIRLIQAKLGSPYHPIGYLFSGALVEKPKYELELKATYGFVAEHLMLWKKERNPAVLEEWLKRVILPLLRLPQN